MMSNRGQYPIINEMKKIAYQYQRNKKRKFLKNKIPVEMSSVSFTYTVTYPRTVMIIGSYTSMTLTAMLRP